MARRDRFAFWHEEMDGERNAGANWNSQQFLRRCFHYRWSDKCSFCAGSLDL